MKKQKNENNLIKENEKMNRQLVALSDEMLEQVSGGVVPPGRRSSVLEIPDIEDSNESPGYAITCPDETFPLD